MANNADTTTPVITPKYLRSVASDVAELREKKAAEKREKCATTLVAAVGLTELKNLLTK